MKHTYINTLCVSEIPDLFQFSPFSKKPFIIKNGAEKWKAIKKWNLNYLIDNIGQVDCNYYKSNSKFHPDFTHNSTVFETKTSTLRDYIKYLLDLDKNERAMHFLSGDKTSIFSNGKLNSQFTPLINDILDFDNIKIDCLKSVGFWLSTKDVVSWLHYDSNGGHNYNVQILGAKKVYLFSPEDAPNLYLFNANETHNKKANINFSHINVALPDLDRFKKAANTLCYSGVISTGDILYIPAYWLHSFEHLGDFNININYSWYVNQLVMNPISLRENFFKAIAKYLGPRYLDEQKYISIAERCKMLQNDTGLDLYNFINEVEKSIV